jgi:DNA-binding transcriptional MerR regulator
VTVPAGRRADDGMSIGAVLKRLQPEFPDLTISKIRYLESEGLVCPQRRESGLRRFAEEDLERLRFVLSAQRDRFWPLKVIKDQLDRLDRGLEPDRPVVIPDHGGRCPPRTSCAGAVRSGSAPRSCVSRAGWMRRRMPRSRPSG